MKLSALLLCSAMMSVALPQRDRRSGFTCNNRATDTLTECLENPRIRISKSSQNYNLRLCSNDDCAAAGGGSELNWIRCRDICSACSSLLGSSATCNSNSGCEDEVDSYLNSFCASYAITPATEAIAVAIVPSQCTDTTVTSTVRPSCSEIVPFSSNNGTTPTPSMGSGVPASSDANKGPTLILGALLGLSLILLAVMTIAFVWTCWKMKKRERERENTNRIATAIANEDYDETERYFKNPTYEGGSSNSTTLPVTYDTVNSTYQTIPANGHTYDVPANENANRHSTASETDVGNSLSSGGSETNHQLNNERNYYQINNDFMDDD